MKPSTPSSKSAHLVHLLTTAGQGDYIGEPISQLAHSLQAAHLARIAGADDATIVAALLHDIGQFLPAAEVRALAHDVQAMRRPSPPPTSVNRNDVVVVDSGSVGRVGHERIGEEYVRRLGFPAKVAALVGSHVAAKRYLCAIDPAYHATLSEASQRSLVFQGGPMTGVEREEWAAQPWCGDMCRLRKWDDGAKVVGLEVAPAETYLPVMERLLAQGC